MMDVWIKRVCPSKGQDPLKDEAGLKILVTGLMEELLPQGISGKRVLVKPNLVKPGDQLAITSAEMILAAALAAKELGAEVTVADSPAFGSAERVLKKADVFRRLRSEGIAVRSLDRPVVRRLACGVRLGISKRALTTDLIINLPRLKAHCQMGATCGVKNLFGTVVGYRKALCHTRFGGDRAAFSEMILDIGKVLPERITIADCTTAMHVTGPSGGRPFYMGLVAASVSEIALDTALYSVIEARPDQIPLWRAAMKRDLRGARPEEIRYRALTPKEAAPAEKFILPAELSPLVFSPARFIRGRIRSVMKKLPFS